MRQLDRDSQSVRWGIRQLPPFVLASAFSSRFGILWVGVQGAAPHGPMLVMTDFFRFFFAAGIVALLALWPGPATAERRVALIIGNSDYQHTSVLPNPRNDAQDLAAALRRLQFDVTIGLDLDKRGMERSIREFTSRLGQADVALFFYAGHAVQVGEQNHLMPIDARLASEVDADFETIPLRLVLQHMERDRENKTSLVFLDACRDNPLAKNLARGMGTRSASVGQGLAEVKGGVGTLIGFSTQPGNVARDGAGRNSPYAEALLRQMEGTEGDINAVLINVRNQVLQTTGGRQVPWEHSSLTRQFHFRQTAPTPSAAELPVSGFPRTGATEEAMAWATTKDTSSIPVLEAFLRRYPSGIYADMAQARLQELKQMKEAREQEARQRTAMAPPPAPPAAAVVPPARTSPSPAPDSLTRPEAIKRISVWIERDFLNDNVTYAEVVDWYDQGTINRDEVLTDRAKYQERWPQRKYTLTPGSVQITTNGPNRYAATFELTYVVRNERRKAQAAGKSRIMVDLEIADGKPRVVRQKEIVGR